MKKTILLLLVAVGWACADTLTAWCDSRALGLPAYTGTTGDTNSQIWPTLVNRLGSQWKYLNYGVSGYKTSQGYGSMLSVWSTIVKTQRLYLVGPSNDVIFSSSFTLDSTYKYVKLFSDTLKSANVDFYMGLIPPFSSGSATDLTDRSKVKEWNTLYYKMAKQLGFRIADLYHDHCDTAPSSTGRMLPAFRGGGVDSLHENVAGYQDLSRLFQYAEIPTSLHWTYDSVYDHMGDISWSWAIINGTGTKNTGKLVLDSGATADLTVECIRTDRDTLFQVVRLSHVANAAVDIYTRSKTTNFQPNDATIAWEKVNNTTFTQYKKFIQFRLQAKQNNTQITSFTFTFEDTVLPMLPVYRVGGNLTENTTWNTGCYYLISDINLGAYNLILNCANGPIDIKTAGGYKINLNGTGACSTANTSSSNSVIFTSKNDNSRSIAPTSTGDPAMGDQTVSYVYSTGAGNLNINNFECRYSTSTSGGVIFNAPSSDALDKVVTIQNGRLKYCKQTASAYGLLGGNFAATTKCKSITYDNISVDTTNKTVAGSYVIMFTPTVESQKLTNSYLRVHAPRQATVAQRNGSCLIKNSILAGDSTTFGLYAYSTAGTNLDTVTNSILIGNSMTANTRGIVTQQGGGTVNVQVKNSTIYNWNGTGAIGVSTQYGGTIGHTYNNYYGNTSNAFEALHASEKTLDPQFTTLPTNRVLSSSSVLPNGFIVGNPSLKKQGSGTFSALTIDTVKYTQTGYLQRQTDTVTPGIYYDLTYLRDAGPTITAQPLPDTANDYSSASFTVAASGVPPISYQWAKNTSGAWVNIGGAASPTYSFTARDSLNNKWFRVSITDANGTSTSDSAQLIVNAIAPVITSHPTNVKQASGKNASFRVRYYGTGSNTVQWQDSVSAWANIVGATDSNYTTGTLDSTYNARKYRSIVTNTIGSDTSNIAVLTVGSNKRGGVFGFRLFGWKF